MFKFNWSWNKKTETPAEAPVVDDVPKQGRAGRAADAVIAAVGKVAMVLALVAVSAASVERTKKAYDTL